MTYDTDLKKLTGELLEIKEEIADDGGQVEVADWKAEDLQDFVHAAGTVMVYLSGMIACIAHDKEVVLQMRPEAEEAQE